MFIVFMGLELLFAFLHIADSGVAFNTKLLTVTMILVTTNHKLLQPSSIYAFPRLPVVYRVLIVLAIFALATKLAYFLGFLSGVIQCW